MKPFATLLVLFSLDLFPGGVLAKMGSSVAKPKGKIDEDFFEAVVENGARRKLGFLGRCESDCDSNNDCQSGLVCWQRRTNDPLPPCCSGSQPYDSRDYCVPSNCGGGGGTTAPGTAPPVTGGGDTSVDVIGVAVVCFSGDTLLQVHQKGTISMRDLVVGDQVLSAQGYQEVYSFGHYNPHQVASFLVLRFRDHEGEIEITPDHLIYLEGKTTPVRASSVKAGDKLAPSGAMVTEIGSTTKVGVYAPLTGDATFLLLEGRVQVSSYAALVQDTDYATFSDGTTQFISQHTGIHMILAPFRIWCRATASQMCNSYNGYGMPHYIANGIRILQGIDQQHHYFQACLFVLAFPLFGALIILEQLLFGSPLLMLVVVGSIISVGQHRRAKTNKSKSL